MLKVFCVIFSAAALLSGGCNGKTEVKNMNKLPENAVILDVRSAGEFAEGHLPGAINVPHDQIAERITAAVPDKTAPLYIYCRSGRRVKIAIEALQKLDYKTLQDWGGMEEAREKLDQLSR